MLSGFFSPIAATVKLAISTLLIIHNPISLLSRKQILSRYFNPGGLYYATSLIKVFQCFFQLLLNDFHSNHSNSVGLFDANFSLDSFCAFLLEHSLTSQVILSRICSFLNDFYFTHCELKLVANINYSLQHRNIKGEIAEWAVLQVREREVNGSNPGMV